MAVFKCGTQALTTGDTDVSLTGLAIGFTPGSVQVSVRQPAADGPLLDAYVAGTPTADGFTVTLSAPVPSTGYLLQWCAFSGTGPSPAGDTLAVAYDELKTRVARFLGYDPTSLATAQADEVDACIQTGVRNFYYPPASEGVDATYEWSFMKMAGSVTTASGVASYALPDGFGQVNGTVRYTGDALRFRTLAVVTRSAIDALTRTMPSGHPRFVCFVHDDGAFGSRGQKAKMLVAPTPDGAYQLSFEASADTGRLDAEARPFPLGGARFSELVIESCLAAAERNANDEEGIHTRNFISQLAAAQAKDRQFSAAQYGAMGNESDLPSPYGEGSRGRDTRFTTVTYKGQTW